MNQLKDLYRKAHLKNHLHMHTGKFAQNFFHISVILGCIPLLFLQFWVKDYKNKPLTILEVIKETLGFILKIMKKIARWRHNQKISIKSMKTTISQLFLHFWSQHGYQKKQKTSRNSNLLVWSATFQPKLNKLWKTIKKVLIFVYFYGFSRVFQSRMKSSGPNPKIWVPWSISLLLTPMLPTGMEK